MWVKARMEIGTKEKMEQGNYWFKEEEKKSRIARGSELEKRQVYEEEWGGGGQKEFNAFKGAW